MSFASFTKQYSISFLLSSSQPKSVRFRLISSSKAPLNRESRHISSRSRPPYSMESRPHIQLCISLGVGIMLAFFFSAIVSGQHDSSGKSEAETSDSFKSDIKNNSSKKYIMESYFERYESLVDSSFQEFLTHESPLSLCKLPSDDISLGLRVSVLNRSLDGEGAHRRLSSSIRFNIMPESLIDSSDLISKVIIIERLPPGVFADPFELQHLVQRGVFTDVEVFGDTNLELPTVVTNRSAVEIHMNVESKNELIIKIELPLHSRYPPLDDSGYTDVIFGSPDLFMLMEHGGLQHKERCLIFPAKELESDAVVWRVPSGRELHTKAVSVATFICALFSTLVIVFTSIFHSDTKTVKLS